MPSSRAAATRTLPPGGPRATPMLRSGRIRASSPPLICSTGISWLGCAAGVTSCCPGEVPAPGTQEHRMRYGPAGTDCSGHRHLGDTRPLTSAAVRNSPGCAEIGSRCDRPRLTRWPTT
jgi:hypothetical protein